MYSDLLTVVWPHAGARANEVKIVLEGVALETGEAGCDAMADKYDIDPDEHHWTWFADAAEAREWCAQKGRNNADLRRKSSLLSWLDREMPMDSDA